MSEATEKEFSHGLDKGYPPVAEKVICIDFDGTITPWGHPSMGDKDPFPGVVEGINRFKSAGWTIVIFTSRLSKTWAKSVVGENGWAISRFLDEQYFYLAELLLNKGVPFDTITSEKVPAQHYVDDKAWRVNEYMPTDVVLYNIAALEGIE